MLSLGEVITISKRDLVILHFATSSFWNNSKKKVNANNPPSVQDLKDGIRVNIEKEKQPLAILL